MTLVVKNVLYQPIIIFDDKKEAIMIKAREKKEITINSDELPQNIKDLENAGFIKIK